MRVPEGSVFVHLKIHGSGGLEAGSGFGLSALPLVVHGLVSGQEKRDRVADLLQTVGLNPKFVTRYPHEFSGNGHYVACHLVH